MADAITQDDAEKMLALLKSTVSVGNEHVAKWEQLEREMRAVIRSVESVPTAEGMIRHEPKGTYFDIPCRCKPACIDPCKGQCGCEACRTAYGDFLSSE